MKKMCYVRSSSLCCLDAFSAKIHTFGIIKRSVCGSSISETCTSKKNIFLSFHSVSTNILSTFTWCEIFFGWIQFAPTSRSVIFTVSVSAQFPQILRMPYYVIVGPIFLFLKYLLNPNKKNPHFCVYLIRYVQGVSKNARLCLTGHWGS